jgi:predicted nucleic acid-binding protein
MGTVMGAELLLDNSAWARLDQPSLAQTRADEIADLLEPGQIAVCLPFLLEAGYSARDLVEHEALVDDLLALPLVSINVAVERRALDAQRQLARAGHRRLPPVDLIIAAAAEVNALGVLHYDGDYDLIAERTDLRFGSVWLAERGSL